MYQMFTKSSKEPLFQMHVRQRLQQEATSKENQFLQRNNNHKIITINVRRTTSKLFSYLINAHHRHRPTMKTATSRPMAKPSTGGIILSKFSLLVLSVEAVSFVVDSLC